MSSAIGTTVRSVITGIGVVAPAGLNTCDYWSAVLRGESGIRRIARFDPSGYSAELAGEIPEYEPSSHLASRLLPQTDRMTRLALIAAEEALKDADAAPRDMPPFACGVVTAASAGGLEFGQKELEALWGKGGKYVSAY